MFIALAAGSRKHLGKSTGTGTVREKIKKMFLSRLWASCIIKIIKERNSIIK